MDPFTLIAAGTKLGASLYGMLAGQKGAAAQQRAALMKGSAAAQQGMMAAQGDMLQADVAGLNAGLLLKQFDLASLGSDYALQKGALEEGRLRLNLDRVAGAQRAGFGANHLDVTTGSPLAMMADSAAQGETDARLIRATAVVSAADAQSRAAAIRGQVAGAEYQRLAALMRANEHLTSSIYGAKAGLSGFEAAGLGAGTALLTALPEAFSGAQTLWAGAKEWWRPTNVGSATKISG